MPDMPALATEVVLIVQKALAPVLERLAAAEQVNRDLQARLQDMVGLRDRLVAVETKSAAPVPTPAVVEPVDLTPVLERLAGAEARISVLGDVRDRVVTMETKAAVPLVAPAVVAAEPVDLTPVLERLTKAETHLAAVEELSTKDAIRIEGYTASLQRKLDEVSERVAVLDARALVPGPPGPPGEPGQPGKDGAVLETKAAPGGPGLAEMELAIVDRLDPLVKQLAAIGERVAVVEVRAQVPGPAGQDGTPGKDGTAGKDGADGLGFDDLTVVQDGERTFTVKAFRGDKAKDIGTLTFPVEIYRGVYLEGKSYERGDRVTWAGSEWHANEATTSKPGDGSKAWTLTVKRGRDGKDGRDAPSIPVVSVGAR